jgi:signal transduction histidine kinase
MKGILILMPLAVISLVLYISQSDVNRASLELEREKQRLERMVFDKEFNEFWDSKKNNLNGEIDRQREKIESLERKNEQASKNLESVHQVISDEMKESSNNSGLVDFENAVAKEKNK